MKELKDPAIKLFGMRIALPEKRKVPVVSGKESEAMVCDVDCSLMVTSCLDDEKVSRVVGEGQEAEKEPMVEKLPETKQQDLTSPVITENLKNQETVPESNENPKTPSIEEDETENDQSDTNDSQQKTLKKPDKILPCPRCSSMDTKFCYYNNYNVNQPRHFCKSCQRYWTAGGTMRNVPVGAGRRKNKNSNSNCRHITISEVLQAAQIDLQNGIHNPHVKTNGTVLSFGSDSRLSESIASVLNLADKKAPNGFYMIQQGNVENGEDCSSGSSVTTSNSTENGSRNGQDPTIQSMNGLPSQIPCLPGVPWPYPWNSAVPIPAFYPPGFPISFYPPPYWNSGFPGTWAIPCLAPITPNTPTKSTNSDPNSPILGKHSREGDLINPINPELKEPIEKKSSHRSVLIPKTLRIDDPDEAAKSSIWTTLGIKNDSINRGGIFKGFESKVEKKIHVAETSPALLANPAAFSRSLTFQES